MVVPPQVLALLLDSIETVGDDGCALGNKRKVGDVTVGMRGCDRRSVSKPNLRTRVLVNVGDG